MKDPAWQLPLQMPHRWVQRWSTKAEGQKAYLQQNGTGSVSAKSGVSVILVSASFELHNTRFSTKSYSGH